LRIVEIYIVFELGEGGSIFPGIGYGSSRSFINLKSTQFIPA